MIQKNSQLDKFKETASEIGADEAENRFDEATKRLVKKPPQNQKEESRNG